MESSKYRGMIAFTYPAEEKVAKVWTDGGEDYICVEGTGAFDDDDNPFLTVAVALYLSDTCPTDWPGLSSSDPSVYQCDVDQSTGDFTFPFFVPGAAGSNGLTGVQQAIAIWGQSQDGTWPSTPTSCEKFNGKYNTTTDCGNSPGEMAELMIAEVPLKVSLPKSQKTAGVMVFSNGQFVAAKGTGAIDPLGKSDIAVAALVAAPTDPNPMSPPFGNANLRIVNVDDQDGSFDFDNPSTYLPYSYAASLGGLGTKCKVIFWPQHSDKSWGFPTVVAFYGQQRNSSRSGPGPIKLKRRCHPCEEKAKRKSQNLAREVAREVMSEMKRFAEEERRSDRDTERPRDPDERPRSPDREERV